jgi:hypothetical protein
MSLAKLIDRYTAKHNLDGDRCMVIEFTNRHHTTCEFYGSRNFSKCDCWSIPKFQAGGMNVNVHEVYDKKSGAVAYILETVTGEAASGQAEDTTESVEEGKTMKKSADDEKRYRAEGVSIEETQARSESLRKRMDKLLRGELGFAVLMVLGAESTAAVRNLVGKECGEQIRTAFANSINAYQEQCGEWKYGEPNE